MNADVLRTMGFKPANPRRAEVLGMALRIGERATLVPDAKASAHGILMKLTHNEIHRLYSEKSVASYRPEAIIAQLSDGTKIPALCFNLPTSPSADKANRHYAEKLREIGERLGLPAHYLDRL